MKKTCFLFLIYGILSHTGKVIGQGTTDSLSPDPGLAFTRAQYTKFIGAGSYLYNGTTYARYWNGVRGFPFFLAEEFQDGDINYGGILYSAVPLMYDISRDELVTKNFSKDTDIKLITEKVNQFFIGRHDFVRLAADNINSSTINPGFYERLYKGITTVYVKHEKKIEKSARAEDNFSKFTQYDSYYLVKDGIFHIIEGEAGLSAALKDQRQEIRKFLARKEINYKKDPGSTIVQVAAFYDGLKK